MGERVKIDLIFQFNLLFRYVPHKGNAPKCMVFVEFDSKEIAEVWALNLQNCRVIRLWVRSTIMYLLL